MVSYLKAAGFGVLMMLAVVGAGCALLLMAFALGMGVFHLTGSKDIALLSSCIAVLVIIGASLGLMDM
jgi:hypothetical protein